MHSVAIEFEALRTLALIEITVVGLPMAGFCV
jgi:hypothetical protein